MLKRKEIGATEQKMYQNKTEFVVDDNVKQIKKIKKNLESEKEKFWMGG